VWRTRFHKTASAWCTEATTIAPSPTAEATRLIDPDRTSPTAKMPAQLVASGCDNAWEDAASSQTADIPVRTNPLSSRATQVSHSVLGAAPSMRNTFGTWRVWDCPVT